MNKSSLFLISLLLITFFTISVNADELGVSVKIVDTEKETVISNKEIDTTTEKGITGLVLGTERENLVYLIPVGVIIFILSLLIIYLIIRKKRKK